MRARKNIKWAAFLLATTVVAAACTVEVIVDPFTGGVVTLDGEWLINSAPADAASCNAAGISRVELRVGDGAGNFSLYESWACSTGFFDARTDASLPLLTNDVWFTQWRALDNSGVEIGRTDAILLDTTSVSHATLLAPDFIVTGPPPGFDPFGNEVSLDGQWMINGKVPTAEDCIAAGISEIQLQILSADGTEAVTSPSVTFACEQGGFDSRPAGVLLAGMYQSTWVALDAAGAELGRIDPPLVLDVTLVDHATLATPDFIVELPAPSLDLFLTWDTDPGPAMVDGTCAEAGVSMFTYQLNDGTGALVSEMIDIACTENITFDDMVPGTYSFFVDGSGAGGAKWMTTCTMLIVEAGVEAYDCAVDQM